MRNRIRYLIARLCRRVEPTPDTYRRLTDGVGGT